MRAADAAPPGARRALFALVDLAPTKELRSTVASLGPWASEPVCVVARVPGLLLGGPSVDASAETEREAG